MLFELFYKFDILIINWLEYFKEFVEILKIPDRYLNFWDTYFIKFVLMIIIKMIFNRK